MPPKPAVEDDFDDDTDFALPAPPAASSSSGMPPGMPEMTPEQMQMFQQMMGGGGGGAGGPPGDAGPAMRPTPREVQEDSAKSAEAKKWITLYPIYFDTKRSHKDGERRVAWRQSCLFPHSLGIAKAVARIGGGLQHVHEAGKTHPRDWENPGRVKVKVFVDDEGKQPINKAIASKKQLIGAVAEYMQQYCGGPPPIAPPKRSKKATTETKSESESTSAAKQGARSGPSAKPAQSAAPPAAAARASAGSSSRSNQLHRLQALRPYLPPTYIRLPPHSPSLSADLLNMDMNKAMGGAGGGAGGAAGGGAPNPMGAIGSMMGNLGFGQDDDDDEGGGDGDKQTEEEKRRQNDPYRGMGRRGRKRVVRVGR